MTQAHIEIVSPIPGKGLGREFLARADIKDEKNYVSIAAILFKEDGSVDQTSEMSVVTTDELQNKTREGTGTLWNNRYVDGTQQPAYVYPFDYHFKTVGDHTITFAAAGLTASVTINVPAKDTRPMSE
jgi:endoglucanase Acf2